MVNKDKFICWDLDETLVQQTDKGLFLRHGVYKGLEELNRIGIQHWITSGMSERAAKNMLLRTRLVEQITLENIWPNDLLDPRGDGKHYAGLEELLFEKKDKYPHKMCVIGDLPYDQPVDLTKLLLINDRSIRNGMGHSTEVLNRIIMEVLRKGRGSFIEGFKSIFRKAERTEVTLDHQFVRRERTTKSVHQARTSIDGGNIGFSLFYRELRTEAPPSFPVICEIDAPKYRMPLARID